MCNQVDSELYEIVLVAITNGLRRSEILKLNWIDIDFKRESIKAVDTKNSESRIVPLVGKALQVLKAKHKTSKTPAVFSKLNTRSRLHKSFRKAVEIVELEDFRFHDLRHTAASYLAMNGATLAKLSDILGHKTLQMVKRYAHFTTGHKKTLVSKMTKSIGL